MSNTTLEPSAPFSQKRIEGAKRRPHMRETNWTARIIAGLVVVVVFGVLIGGYIVSNQPPKQQQIEQAVPNDRLPG
jgi:hypothetical protein